MQVSSVTFGQLGRCKSASAADFKFCSRWRSRNCRPECLRIATCTENATSEWPQKLAARLSLANDAEELMCRCHPHSTDAQSGGLAACCMRSKPVSSHTVVAPFHTECHCVACCSCSPFDRRSGNCPAFIFPSHQVPVRRSRSLDSGLAQCRSCSEYFSAARDSSCAGVAELEQNSVECDAVIHKSSSVPACCSSQMRYYNTGISFDSLNDDTFYALDACVDSSSTDSNSTPVCDDEESCGVVTQCPDESQIPSTPTCVSYMNDEVSPVEYHRRFQVCSFTVDISKCSTVLCGCKLQQSVY